MAINKNFVIKNGVQVSTDLIIGDADTNKVGIGTTVPGYDLHIGIGRKSRGGIGATDLVVTGVATVTNLSVTGISTFAGALDVNSTVDFASDVVFNGTNDITFDQSESALVLNDGAAIRVGTSSDFSIMHDGSNTILRDGGTGDLKLYGSRIEIGGNSVDETIAFFTENAGAQLYFNNENKFQTVALGATVFGDLVVSGVTTSARLLVSGISTFTGLVDANGGAHIDNLRLGIDADNDITTSSGNLTLDSTGGTVEVNDNLQVDGQTDLNGDINLGDATSETITVTARFDSDLIPSTDGTRDLGSSSLEWQDLHLTGTANIDTLDVDATSNFADDVTLVAAGSSTILFDASAHQIVFQDNIRAKFGTGSDLSVYHNGTHSYVENSTGDLNLTTTGDDINITAADDIALLVAGSEYAMVAHGSGAVELYYDNSKKVETTSGGLNVTGITTISDRLQVTSGISTFYDTTQSTSATTGAVILDGGLGVAKNVNIGGNLTVTGTTTFNGGTITLGDADTDNVVFSADVDSNIIPDDDNTHDLGSSSKQWKDIYVNGVGYIDSISADTAAISDLTNNRVVIAGSSGELEDDANLTFDGAKFNVGSGVTIQPHGGVSIAGITTINGAAVLGSTLAVAGITSLGGNVTLGNANDDNITITGRINSNLIPDADDTYNLGTSGLEWQDLFIDGTANIDTLAADTAAIGDLTSGRVVLAGTSGELEDSGNLTFDGSTLAITGSIDLSADIDVDGVANLDNIDVDGTANFADDVTLVAAGSSTILFDASAHDLIFQDNIRAKFGTGSDLDIHHNGTDSVITNATNDLNIITTGDDINITAADDINLLVQGGENGIAIKGDAEVILYHNNLARVTTTSDGADFGGTGAIRIPNGTTGERPGSSAAGDFRYNTTTGKFEGYTDEWGDIGGSGGVEETSTSVSSTSATSTGSFAKATFRSASIIAQITQGSAYQVGRYLLIHDGTTVTTIEESAVATGSMLGTFEGVINGSNVEFRVTMGSSSSATVKTKIDTVTV